MSFFILKKSFEKYTMQRGTGNYFPLRLTQLEGFSSLDPFLSTIHPY